MTAHPPTALLSLMESLADPTRLRLLRLLERHELGVAELVQVLQLPQSTVSRHLKVLADRGWVQSRSQGTTNLYGMAPSNGDGTARKLWLLTREKTEEWATVHQDQLRLQRCLSRRQGSSQEFFAGAANRWDRLREEMYGRAFALPALLGLLPNDWVVADLGCGTGWATAALAPHLGRVIGVDFSQAMLKAARKRTQGLPNVELRKGSLEALPIESGGCDGALLLLVLAYVAEPAPVVRELARVLKPGGRAVVVDLLRHDREDFRRQMGQQHLGFEPPDLARLLGEAGLVAVRCQELPPEPEARGPALLLATATRQGPSSHSANEGERKP
jgi:ArsR family transcriptional regulator